MCPTSWRPKTDRLQQLIQEEESRIEALATRRFIMAEEERLPQVWFPPEVQRDAWDTGIRSMPLEHPSFVTEDDLPLPSHSLKSEAGWINSLIQTPQKPESVPMTQHAFEKEPVPEVPVKTPWWSKPFEFVHEKIEKPYASILTAPWSPGLPWLAGESWLEHEKREYDAWKAPKFVKGAVEFTMPLWWLPWFGWAAKGARALNVGSKMVRAVDAIAPKAGKLVLPSKEMMNETLYKMDFGRTFSIWAENKPILGKVVEALGGPSAFVRATSKLPQDVARREVVNRAVMRSMAGDAENLLMVKLQRFGDPRKVLDIADGGLLRGVTPKTEGASRYLYDVLENPNAYAFATKNARQYVDELHDVLNEVKDVARQEGIKVADDIIVHRIVKAVKLTPEGKLRLAREKGITVEQLEKELGEDIMEVSDFGSRFEMARRYKTMEQGVKAGGVQYGINPNESVAATIRYYVRRIADKRFDDEIKKLGKTPRQKYAETYIEQAEKIETLLGRRDAAKDALATVRRVTAFKGTTIPGATMAKIRRSLPEVADKIDAAFALKPDQVDKVLANMSAEIRRVMKLKPKEFKFIVNTISEIKNTWRAKKVIHLSDIDDAIRHLNVSNDVAARAVEKMYRQSYRLNKQAVDDAFKIIKNDADALIKTSREELSPLLSHRRAYLSKYRKGGQIISEHEFMFREHPAFRGLVFDRAVADQLQGVFRDGAPQWLRGMSSVSSASRMLTATMDFSAPFIQGSPVFGRNPGLWAKATLQHYTFFARPQNLTKYLASSESMAIRAERVKYGGSTAAFEYFEALLPLQRTLKKVPAAGEFASKVVSQTYGRAETAFLGFSEVTKNGLWTAMRKPGMADDQLRELARTIDRMTGSMSTEALGIRMTQREIEKAFVFFSPRYSRASLALVGDVFKGGLTGAEARKALGGMIGGGIAMYVGVSKALGQEPEFNPNSARFMTVKIGDSFVGVGGVFYSLMRMNANVIGLVAGQIEGDKEQNLSKLLEVDRFDNPFLRFMYSRSSPLTGLAVGAAIEHKDFLGRPLENGADWARFLSDKVTPIALQRMTPWSEEPVGLDITAAEIGGLRTFPKSPSVLRDEARDKHARERFGLEYRALPRLQQEQIDKLPDVQTFVDEADQRALELGRGLGKAFVERRKEMQDARYVFEDNLRKYQDAFDDGVISGFDFKELMSTERERLGATYEHINRQPRYTEVIERLENPRQVNPKYVGDIAYDELMKASFSNQFDDQYGIFDFDAYNEFKESLRRKYGEEIYWYIQQRLEESRSTLPPLAQQYYQAQEIMKPYWQVRDRVIKLFGKRFAESSKGQSLISKLRKQKRMSNPEMERAYQMFYASQ